MGIKERKKNDTIYFYFKSATGPGVARISRAQKQMALGLGRERRARRPESPCLFQTRGAREAPPPPNKEMELSERENETLL